MSRSDVQSAARHFILIHIVLIRCVRSLAALCMIRVSGGAATGHERHRVASTAARTTRLALVTWAIVAALAAATGACSPPPPVPGAQSASGAADCSRFEGATRTPNRSIAPGEQFRVEWRFANCGRTDWNGYRAVRIEGNLGPEVIPIQAAPAGTSSSIWIELVAPTAPGRYRLTYQLQGAGGPFGRFWTDFTVENQ